MKIVASLPLTERQGRALDTLARAATAQPLDAGKDILRGGSLRGADDILHSIGYKFSETL